MQALPAIDFAQRDLTAGQQRPEQHAGGFGAVQHALDLDAALELLVQRLNGVGSADGLSLLWREAQEGEQFSPASSRLSATVRQRSGRLRRNVMMKPYDIEALAKKPISLLRVSPNE